MHCHSSTKKKFRLEDIVSTDETTVRYSATSVNTRNARVWVGCAEKKCELPAAKICKPKSGFSVGVMTHVCVNMRGNIRPTFAPTDAKVNAKVYQSMLEQSVIPSVLAVTKKNNVVWQEDNCTSHSAKSTQIFLKKHFKTVLSFPSKSPDLPPLDYAINSKLKELVAKQVGEIAKPAEVRAAIIDVVENMDRDFVKRVIESFKKRCVACVRVKGDLFEHTLSAPSIFIAK